MADILFHVKFKRQYQTQYCVLWDILIIRYLFNTCAALMHWPFYGHTKQDKITQSN